jgi:hypothetical protein
MGYYSSVTVWYLHCGPGVNSEMSTRIFLGGKGQPAHKADNLTTLCELTVKKMWQPRCLTTLWASMACYKDSFTFFPPFLLCGIYKSHNAHYKHTISICIPCCFVYFIISPDVHLL